MDYQTARNECIIVLDGSLSVQNLTFYTRSMNLDTQNMKRGNHTDDLKMRFLVL